jgi:hypothetical protein
MENFAVQVGKQEVSRLSGVRILARIHMALRDAEFVFSATFGGGGGDLVICLVLSLLPVTPSLTRLQEPRKD